MNAIVSLLAAAAQIIWCTIDSIQPLKYQTMAYFKQLVTGKFTSQRKMCFNVNRSSQDHLGQQIQPDIAGHHLDRAHCTAHSSILAAEDSKHARYRRFRLVELE